MRRFVWLLLPLLFACPPPKPTPTPTPPPTPEPTPGICCNVPPADAEGWSVVTPKPAAYNTLFVVDAETQIGNVCGAVPDVSLQRLAAVLMADHYLCAAQWANKEGTLIDAVVVLRPDGLWEEIHAVSYATGCWAYLPNQYKNAWRGPTMIGRGCK